MNSNRIAALLRSGELRQMSRDLPRSRSLVSSAEKNAAAALQIALSDGTSTVIFKEIYDSIRQSGDAMWWLIGYEPKSHSASLEILREDAQVSDKVSLENLQRFKNMRNDSEYSGYTVSVAQAREIVDFWKTTGLELLKWMKKRVA